MTGSTSGDRRIRRPGDWLLSVLTVLSLVLVVSCSGSCGGPATAQASTQGAQPTAQAQAHDAEDEHAEGEEDEDAIAVRVHGVALEPVASLYTTSATLRADKRATITARTNGVVRELLVEEGDRVRAGQPLAILEDDQQRIEFERATTTRDNQLREYERAQRLHDQGLVSEEEYETTRREAEEARHTAELAELMLERTVIRASFSGTVLRRYLDVGGTVTDGTPFYDLADLDPLYADVNVPERQIARLLVGQQVRLSTDSDGGTTRATIERIAPLVDPATGTVKVTLSVSARQDLRPGSFVRVDIVTDTHEQALVVPRSALVAEGRRWHLYRVVGEGREVQRLEVLRGFEEGNRVEILPGQDADQQLSAGDEVVVVGASALTDGARIEIMRDEGQNAEGDEEAVEDESSRVAT